MAKVCSLSQGWKFALELGNAVDFYDICDEVVAIGLLA